MQPFVAVAMAPYVGPPEVKAIVRIVEAEAERRSGTRAAPSRATLMRRGRSRRRMTIASRRLSSSDRVAMSATQGIGIVDRCGASSSRGAGHGLVENRQARAAISAATRLTGRRPRTSAVGSDHFHSVRVAAVGCRPFVVSLVAGEDAMTLKAGGPGRDKPLPGSCAGGREVLALIFEGALADHIV
jgi:hypothetical protein